MPGTQQVLNKCLLKKKGKEQRREKGERNGREREEERRDGGKEGEDGRSEEKNGDGNALRWRQYSAPPACVSSPSHGEQI